MFLNDKPKVKIVKPNSKNLLVTKLGKENN